MKKTDDILKRLATYSGVAGAIIGVTPTAQAELVGYDVDPDSLLLNPQDTAGYYLININNSGDYCDGYNDLDFTLTKYTTGPSSWYNGQFLNLYMYTSNYALASKTTYQYTSTTITNTITTTYGGTIQTTTIGTITSTWYTANVLSPGSYASAGANSGLPTWATFSVTMVWGYTEYAPGSSWGAWGDKTDKYVGLKFTAYLLDSINTLPGDTTWFETVHYGWIYMSVGIDAEWYQVQAWAYADVPGEPAETDMDAVDSWDKLCEFVGIDDKNLAKKVSIYSHDRNVRVGLSGINKPTGTINIYNVSGKLIQSQPIKGENNSLRVKGKNTGIFVVKVDVNGAVRSKKVYIN